MKLTIDLDKLKLAADKAGQIVLEPEGETHLLRILEAREKVDEIYEAAKAKLEQDGLALSENLTSIVGESVRVGYQYFGKRFEIVAGMEEMVPQEIIKKVVKYDLDPKLVESYHDEHGLMPDGVIVRNRKKLITIKRVGEADEE